MTEIDLQLSALDFKPQCDSPSCRVGNPSATHAGVLRLPCGCVRARLLCGVCAANQQAHLLQGSATPLPPCRHSNPSTANIPATS